MREARGLVAQNTRAPHRQTKKTHTQKQELQLWPDQPTLAQKSWLSVLIECAQSGATGGATAAAPTATAGASAPAAVPSASLPRGFVSFEPRETTKQPRRGQAKSNAANSGASGAAAAASTPPGVVLSDDMTLADLKLQLKMTKVKPAELAVAAKDAADKDGLLTGDFTWEFVRDNVSYGFYPAPSAHTHTHTKHPTNTHTQTQTHTHTSKH